MMSVGRIGCALWPWSYYIDIFVLQKNNVFQQNNGLVTCKWWPAPSAPFVQWWLLTTASSIYVWSRTKLFFHSEMSEHPAESWPPKVKSCAAIVILCWKLFAYRELLWSICRTFRMMRPRTPMLPWTSFDIFWRCCKLCERWTVWFQNAANTTQRYTTVEGSSASNLNMLQVMFKYIGRYETNKPQPLTTRITAARITEPATTTTRTATRRRRRRRRTEITWNNMK